MIHNGSDEAVDLTRLCRELANAAQRLLRNIFRQAGDTDETAVFPVLAAQVKRIVGTDEWLERPTAETITVIRRAIAALPESMSGRAPGSPPEATGNNIWKGQNEQLLAAVILGYRNDLVTKPSFADDYSYDHDYFPAARQMSGFGDRGKERTFRRMLQVIREDLAYALISMEPRHSTRLLTEHRAGAEVDAEHLPLQKISKPSEPIRLNVVLAISSEQNEKSYFIIDEDGVAHPIPDQLTADLLGPPLLTPLSEVEAVQKGNLISPVGKHSFRQRNGDFFVIVDKWLIYLHTLAPVYRFWSDAADVPELLTAEAELLRIR